MTDTAAAPPIWAVALAERFGRHSECAKSRRGAVLYTLGTAPATVLGAGYNGPPPPFRCTGTDRCRAICRQICVHAEARAVRDIAMIRAVDPAQLVHVKLGPNGRVVPGGPPSCVSCSKWILDSGVSGVWLYEHIPLALGGRWRHYDTEDFHRCSLANEGFREESAQ